ncbi:MAG: hypothetical protein H0X03_00375 [Nitrosopumilus sp.]|nr:hypothetical protein [Nitrosopumilus sp.]
MLTGKMTATWWIIVTMVACLVVPILIIYSTTVHPYLESHPAAAPKLILGVITFLPNVSIIDYIVGTLI